MTEAEKRRGGHAPAAHRRRRTRRATPLGAFYAAALDAGERGDLEAAAGVRGLDQEIALLRVWLRRLLAEQPGDFELAVKAITLLVRAVSAAGRLPSDDDNLLDRVTAELNEVLAALAGESAVE